MNHRPVMRACALLVGAFLSVPAGFTVAAEQDARGITRKAADKKDVEVTTRAGVGYLSAVADLRVLPAPERTKCPTTGADIGNPDRASLTLAQALKNLDGFLRDSESEQALKALDAAPEARNPQRAAQLAMIAMADRRPGAAMALLLKAHRTAPDDPTHLSNLAGIANTAGQYAEALALVTAAEVMKKAPSAPAGLDGRAVLLNNKGDALLGLARAKEAEAALTESLRLQPDFAEASTNLAYALGDQGKCQEAIRALRTGGFRKKPKDPDAVRLPLDQALDISRGKPGVLPSIPLPRTPEEAVDNHQRMLDRAMSTMAETQAIGAKLGDAEGAVKARREAWRKRDVSGRLTAERATLLKGAVQDFTRLGKYQYKYDAEIDQLNRSYLDAREALLAAYRKANRESSEALDQVAKSYSSQAKSCRGAACQAVEAAMRSEQCNVARGFGGKVRPAAREFDRALHVFFRESYRRASTAASYYSDPAYQNWAKLRLQEYHYGAYYELLEDLHKNFAGPFAQYGQACTAKEQGGKYGEETSPLAELCQALPGVKLQVSAGVMDMSVSCEQIEIGAQTPGFIGLFGQVNYEFGSGNTTVFGGTAAGMSAFGAGASAKFGGYVVVDSKGNLSDLGVKTTASVSASVHVGPVSVGKDLAEGSWQTSFVSSRPSIGT